MMSNLAREKRTAKDWSEMSLVILTEIASRIIEYKEFVWFGSVCKSWKLAASLDNFRAKSTSPFLLVRCRHDTAATARFIYDLTSRQPYPADSPSFFQSGKISSKGWVLEVTEIDLQPLLWNHSTVIELPDFRCLRCYGDILSFRLQRFDISSDPSFTSNYTVILTAEVLICGDRRYHGGSGLDLSMTFLWHAQGGNLHGGHFYGCNHPGWSAFPSNSKQIACFKGLLASFQSDGSFDVRGPNYRQILPVPKFPYELQRQDLKYMMESQKGLMVIVQCVESFQTKEFHVFELDWASKEWTQVEDLDLGRRALFLKTSQTPILLDCNRFLANKIYSISTSNDDDHKVEIYNFATKSSESPLQFPLCHIEPCRQARWIFQNFRSI